MGIFKKKETYNEQMLREAGLDRVVFNLPQPAPEAEAEAEPEPEPQPPRTPMPGVGSSPPHLGGTESWNKFGQRLFSRGALPEVDRSHPSGSFFIPTFFFHLSCNESQVSSA